MNNNIEVSVYCLAYNHEKFIKKCLDGFVCQKTNFRFEVIIHDDASTDHTADIIKEYAEKYPDIIKPVLQTQNQYSKGISILYTYIAAKLQGRYIAICEGDDYWINENKLQIQYDYMTAHPDCTACVHNAIVHNCSNNSEWFVTNCQIEKDYSIDEIITGGGGLFATNSTFIKKEIFLNKPECFNCRGVGDYQNMMYAAIHGTVHYFPLFMSVYNKNVTNSWTDRIWNNADNRIKHYRELMNMLKNVDDYYQQKYTKPITEMILYTEFQILKLTKNYTGMKDKKYARLYKAYLAENGLDLSFKERVYKNLEKSLPGTMSFYKKMKSKLK